MALTFHPRPQNPAPPLDDIPRLVEIGQLSPRDALHLMSTNTTVKLPASRENLSKRVEAGDGTGRERTADDSPGRGMQPSSKVDEALKELETLIGLDEVKHLVKEISAFVEIQRRRSRAGLAAEPLALHMVFRGNPGTGKTTVARILGRVFKEMSVLQKGHLVEVERADLVGEYIGHTAQKTRDQIKRALGGILFIDEAYSLARGGEKDFGKEAIDTLVKAMEDHKDDLILILAGYREEMARFLRTNPGLKSRFPIHIDFPDYTCDELMKIAEAMLKVRQYSMSPDARARLTDVLKDMSREVDLPQGNARFVRNLIEKAVRRQAVRLIGRQECSRDDLMTIASHDIDEAIGQMTNGRSRNVTPGQGLARQGGGAVTVVH